MWRVLSWLVLAVACMGAAAPPRASPPCVLRATVGGIVTSGTADYVEEAIAEAADCEALLLVVDTPGGAMEATRRIVQLLLTSPLDLLDAFLNRRTSTPRPEARPDGDGDAQPRRSV